MWLDAQTARRLTEARGADLRTIVLDDTGAVVGVGRRARIAPGWLRDATLALHDTCSTPSCATAARICHTDHATPWHPHRPADPLGRTDIDQLAPLCSRDNRTKERDGWRTTQTADGTRTWHHARSGLTVQTLPATRPPPPGTLPPRSKGDPPRWTGDPPGSAWSFPVGHDGQPPAVPDG